MTGLLRTARGLQCGVAASASSADIAEVKGLGGTEEGEEEEDDDEASSSYGEELDWGTVSDGEDEGGGIEMTEGSVQGRVDALLATDKRLMRAVVSLACDRREDICFCFHGGASRSTYSHPSQFAGKVDESSVPLHPSPLLSVNKHDRCGPSCLASQAELERIRAPVEKYLSQDIPFEQREEFDIELRRLCLTAIVQWARWSPEVRAAPSRLVIDGQGRTHVAIWYCWALSTPLEPL